MFYLFNYIDIDGDMDLNGWKIYSATLCFEHYL